ncbi:hypothetical protein [Dactylosporangium sp. CA-139066]|uniref:hypothetical protein n=1 Tax=Dactylosporangium sp. CA-139066 TaxID=3239930 RepID=UPI003D8D403A
MGMKAPLGLLLAVLLLGGCAEKSRTAVPPAPSTATSEPSTATSEQGISVPSKVPKTTKAEPPVDDFQQVTAQGRVKVTGACTELVTDQLTWTLIGPPAASLRDGQQAKVVGVPDPNRETGCAGSPLLVSQALPV